MSSCVGRRLSSFSDAKPPMTFFASPTTDYVGVFQWLMVIELWKCSTGSYPTRSMGCLDNYGYRESIPELATHIFNSRTPLSTSQNVNPSEKPNEFIFSFFDQSLSRRAWRVSPSHVIKCMIFQSTSNGNKLYRIKSGRVPWPFDKQMVPPFGNWQGPVTASDIVACLTSHVTLGNTGSSILTIRKILFRWFRICFQNIRYTYRFWTQSFRL